MTVACRRNQANNTTCTRSSKYLLSLRIINIDILVYNWMYNHNFKSSFMAYCHWHELMQTFPFLTRDRQSCCCEGCWCWHLRDSEGVIITWLPAPWHTGTPSTGRITQIRPEMTMGSDPMCKWLFDFWKVRRISPFSLPGKNLDQEC